LFKDGSTPADLSLVDISKMGSDVLLLTYRPAKRPS
jgi:hypothetical protein